MLMNLGNPIKIHIQIPIEIKINKSSNTNTNTNNPATDMADGGVQQYLPPSTNQSLGIEAGACVKVIATSRRTRQN